MSDNADSTMKWVGIAIAAVVITGLTCETYQHEKESQRKHELELAKLRANPTVSVEKEKP